MEIHHCLSGLVPPVSGPGTCASVDLRQQRSHQFLSWCWILYVIWTPRHHVCVFPVFGDPDVHSEPRKAIWILHLHEMANSHNAGSSKDNLYNSIVHSFTPYFVFRVTDPVPHSLFPTAKRQHNWGRVWSCYSGSVLDDGHFVYGHVFGVCSATVEERQRSDPRVLPQHLAADDAGPGQDLPEVSPYGADDMDRGSFYGHDSVVHEFCQTCCASVDYNHCLQRSDHPACDIQQYSDHSLEYLVLQD